ncbi:MAG: zinc ribbon domain-containing protein [Gammaproteobacteria bacterium]|nr:zinc ribbon domain-containing protein [Gammaproteobacteria bacterium]
MPIYEYRCETCGHELEKIQRFSDLPLTDCPSCGKASLKKLMSAAAFQLKGEGWYVTDFKNPKKDKTPAATSAETTEKTATAPAAAEASSDPKSSTETKDTKKAVTTVE